MTLAVHPGWAYYRLLHGFEPGDPHVLYRLDRVQGVGEEWTGSAWEPISGERFVRLYRLVNTGDPSFDPIDPHEALEETTPRNINKYSPDQPRDDHGRFGESDTPPGDVASAITAGVEQGGFTVHPTRASSPTTGYQVALQGRGTVVDAAILNDHEALLNAVHDMVEKNQDVLKPGGRFYIGGWADSGKLYLDVSERMSSRAAAVQAGQDRNQISIWDNARKTEIPTGGTGT